MKSTKTKKLLGGVAIAAVSLGCLGLAGIANANTTTGASGSSNTQTNEWKFSGAGDPAGSPTAQTSGAYQLGTLSGVMSGTTTITANISTAQTTAGQIQTTP